ncbi:hypothetical protein BX600DRAFT_505758 [Xylariales sp. PMI_506]|nr:hypothetical protein BX600DRAFT_505758 [Xylariales sp. PMI_506]
MSVAWDATAAQSVFEPSGPYLVRPVRRVADFTADRSFSQATSKMPQSEYVIITAGPYQFLAVFEDAAPKTIEVFRKLLPYKKQLIHVRWSGEGLWVPLGDEDFGVSFENHTTHPSAGHILLYPGGFSETELLFCYGGVSFASKMGSLAANHFLTIIEGNENLKALGELVLWKGAQDVLFEIADETRIRRFYESRTGKESRRPILSKL